jgi:hypothetical protein
MADTQDDCLAQRMTAAKRPSQATCFSGAPVHKVARAVVQMLPAD